MEILSSLQDLRYIALMLVLFLLPFALQRYRIPGAITSFILGLLASAAFGWFQNDRTVQLLATLGIVSMFLFAGLEMDFHLLLRKKWVLLQHLVLQMMLILLLTGFIIVVFSLGARPSMIFALALLTPSAGFILNALASSGLADIEKEDIKSLVLSNELVTLILLFFITQTTSIVRIAISSAALVGLIVLIPLLFKLFHRLIMPFAPKSEFAFLILLAVVSAVITRKLGVYYLLGAFVVGATAQQFREQLPNLTSENMLHAVEMFASLFVPFYFFYSGTHIHREDFQWSALLLGIGLVMMVLPLRFLRIDFHRRYLLREHESVSWRIAVRLMPTLVFTIVLAEMLRDQFAIDSYIYGALILYAIIASVLPSFLPVKTRGETPETNSSGWPEAVASDDTPGDWTPMF